MSDNLQASTAVTWTRQELTVDGVALDVATMRRSGAHVPILFLHGFGSTKEDYADIVHHRAFDGHPVVAYDVPGCSETTCGDLAAISIPFLMDTALAVLDRLGVERFHLVGHSMGGLTALLLASQHPDGCSASSTSRGTSLPRTASSAGRSSPTRPQTAKPSFKPSSNATGARGSTPARYSSPACPTRSAPAQSAESSSRWST